MSRVDRVLVELEAGRQALDDAREAGAVRLAGGDETERHEAVQVTCASARTPRRVTRACEATRQNGAMCSTPRAAA